jgi:hypothetical protein
MILTIQSHHLHIDWVLSEELDVTSFCKSLLKDPSNGL